MERALALARKAQGSTSPNPPVGAVIARDDVVVGTGNTQPPGGPHAEVIALRAAGERAIGATIYVTLEPCSHWGRTPPCVDALIDAGITEAHIALLDPNPLVHGQGAQRLRDHGITVEIGEEAVEAAELIEAHAVYVTRHRPLVTLLLCAPGAVVEREVANADVLLDSQPVEDVPGLLADLARRETTAIVSCADSAAGIALLRAGVVDRIVAGPKTPASAGFQLHQTRDDPAPHVVFKPVPCDATSLE
jgi:pyrimidine deaminase RibD-like protein